MSVVAPGRSVPERAGSGGDLTPRQLEILALLKAGKANKDIAYELGIGLGTVKQHVVALFKKLNVTNRAMAVGKGWQMAGRVHAPEPADTIGNTVESALELRPACVLSLAADAAPDAAEAWRLLQNAAARAAATEDSILVARPASGVDVIFGLNRVREDDVLRALKVARAIALAVAEACRSEGRPSLVLRAGLCCGHLVASIERKGGWTGETVAGRLIGDARALRAAAGPDCLLVDGAAQRMMAFACRADGVPPPDGAGVLRLSLGQEQRRSRHSSGRPLAMVGRTAELDRLSGWIERLRGGLGGLVWLEGEAGMGKTTLGHAFAVNCRKHDLGWVEWRCGGERKDLGGALLALVGRRTRQAEPPVAMVVEALRAQAGRGPMALMIDDVHLAPARDAALIVELAGLARSVPLLLLGVGRSLRPAGLRDLPGDETIKLARLSAEEVTALIRLHGKGRLRGGQAQALVELAQGVPLFAHELALEALRRGTEAAEAPRLPLTLGALVMSRLDTLGLDRPLMRLTARPGGIVPAELAALWPGQPDELEHEIGRAVRAGILVQRDDGSVAFAHPMVRAILAHVLMAGQGQLATGLDAGRAAIAAG